MATVVATTTLSENDDEREALDHAGLPRASKYKGYEAASAVALRAAATLQSDV